LRRAFLCSSPDETGLLIVQVGQFDLQSPFLRAGAMAEDLENQAGAVQDLDVPGLLEVALLAR